MFDAIKPLLDSGIINEDTRQALGEAWETKLDEARDQIRGELREEFSQRYEHDKGVMVESLDRMVTEALSAEIKEFADEKQALAEDRVRFQRSMVENAGKFDQFMVSKLAEELTELRHDRKQYQESVSRLENFVIRALAEEIQEFETDKRAVVEARVRLVSEAKQKLGEIKAKFIERSAKLVKEAVSANLETEITQLKEDVQSARENMFGRRLFEAFASEFAVTHLNENREISQLKQVIVAREKALAEAKSVAEAKSLLAESKEREIKIIKETANRKQMLADMLKPLNKEKAAIMSDLLESVQTDRLQNAFEKYLPAVLNNASPKVAQKTMLSENHSVQTGDKAAKVSATDNTTTVVEFKRLAGLK